MNKFWYNFVKPKYGEKVKLCYMDTDSLIVYTETDDIYKDIAEDVETRFDTLIMNQIDIYLKKKIKK